jgi:methenyltetrahydrofolate cyclohydrolase
MRTDTVENFLQSLAAKVPAPGGGATAALHAAQAAALVAMVARYSEGPRFAEQAELVQKIRHTADRLRDEALTLAEDDVAAFTAVTEAYRLPKGDDGASAERSTAIEAATLGAARPPEALVRLASQVLDLAEDLVPVANRNVISDGAAAAKPPAQRRRPPGSTSRSTSGQSPGPRHGPSCASSRTRWTASQSVRRG